MIEFFNVAPGSDIGESQDEPGLLIGVGKPDWVRVPPEAGGGTYRCLEIIQGTCPLPGHGEECRHFILDGPIRCAECVVSAQFVWYKIRQKKGE